MTAPSLWQAWCALRKRYYTPPAVVEHIKRVPKQNVVIGNPPYRKEPR